MNKSLSVIFIGIILVVSFFVGYTLLKGTDSISSDVENGENITQDIPPAVLAKYEELEPKFKILFGAGINLCTKNNEKIYTVWGSSGYMVVKFYYTEDGDEIGSSYITDEVDPNNPPPKPPVNIKDYECTVIKESE